MFKQEGKEFGKNGALNDFLQNLLTTGSTKRTAVSSRSFCSVF